jgi:hypothetical protein
MKSNLRIYNWKKILCNVWIEYPLVSLTMRNTSPLTHNLLRNKKEDKIPFKIHKKRKKKKLHLSKTLLKKR